MFGHGRLVGSWGQKNNCNCFTWPCNEFSQLSESLLLSCSVRVKGDSDTACGVNRDKDEDGGGDGDVNTNYQSN